MEKFAGFIVRKRNALFGGLLFFAIISLFLASLVVVNLDMTEYLPEDSNLRAGLEVMEEEFGHLETNGLLHIMFEDLSEAEMHNIHAQLYALGDVLHVAFDIESDAHVRDGYALYSLTLAVGMTGDEEYLFVQNIWEEFTDFTIHLSGDLEGVVPLLEDMMLIMIPTVIVLVVIFFVMCRSWFEPIIFFINIGIAILINTGTNEIFSHISAPSDMIAGVLQIALSMDYAIIFLNRYRREKDLLKSQGINDIQLAMKNTIANSFSAVSGIAFTTILGMLMLVFMSFTIGADIGLVIAKSVFISLVCVFGVMPALILWFDKIIEKTKKPALTLTMRSVANFSFKTKYVIAILFVILIASGFILQSQLEITYSELELDRIYQTFDIDNTFVLLYDNADEGRIEGITNYLLEQDEVLGVYSYSGLFGQRFTDLEMAIALEMDDWLIGLIYRNYFLEELPALSLGEFLQFLQEISEFPIIAEMMPPEEMAGLVALPEMIEPEMMLQEFSPIELAMFLEFDVMLVEQIFYLYVTFYGEPLEEVMSLLQLIDYLLETFAPMPIFEPLFTDEVLAVFEDARHEIISTTNALVAANFSRMMINTSLPIETEATFLFIDDLMNLLNEDLSGDFYLLGESIMPYELNHSFPNDHLLIAILTVAAFFLVIAVSFKSMMVAIILAIVIQGSVYIAMGASYFLSSRISFLDIVIVQAILKGRVIDYGILYIANYIEARRTMEVRDGMQDGLRHSIDTILTSGLIIVLVTFVCGIVFMGISVSIAQILFLIAQGCLIGVLLSVFVLPALIAVCDRLIIRKKKLAPKEVIQ